jgi:hypothetical protein
MSNLTIADNLSVDQIENYCVSMGINDTLTLEDAQTLYENNYGKQPHPDLPLASARNYYIEGYDDRGNKIAEGSSSVGILPQDRM